MSDLKDIVELFDRAVNIIDLQRNTLSVQTTVIEGLKEVIDIKDQIIDKQLQTLQLPELKLKEFGVELGDSEF